MVIGFLVGLAAGLDTDLFPDRSLVCSGLAIVCTEASRGVLSVLWQVEAATLGLAVAAALFAFEGAVRHRGGVGLAEYGLRTGLIQYVMLGVSGLVSIGVALVAREGRPPPLAAAIAILTAGLGIVLFPFFVRRSISVVGLEYFRRARLAEIHEAVEAEVRRGALADSAAEELGAWAADHEGVSRAYWRAEGSQPVEVAGDAGVVFDVDVKRLRTATSSADGDWQVLVGVGDSVHAGQVLLAYQGHGDPASPRPAFVLTKPPGADPVAAVLVALKEEGTEAIRTRSEAAVVDVAAGYSEVLGSWPKVWSDLAREPQSGFKGSSPLGLGAPLSGIRRDLWTLVDQARAEGLDDHVLALTGIAWTVMRAAIEVRDHQTLAGMSEIMRSHLTPRTSERELADLVASRVAYFHSETADHYLGRRLRQAEDPDQILFWTAWLRHWYEQTADVLRRLVVAGHDDEFEELDRRLHESLKFWHGALDEYDVAHRLANPGAYSAAQLLEAELEQVAIDARQELRIGRTANRLSLLGWMTTEALRAGDDFSWQRAWSYATRLPSLRELVVACRHALEHGGLSSSWSMHAMVGQSAGFVDSDGPVLRGLVLAALAKRPTSLSFPPLEWATDDRLERLGVLGEEVGAASFVAARLEETGQKLEAVDLLRHECGVAHQAWAEQEEDRLIEAVLSDERVAEFREAVIASWTESRLLPAAFRHLAGAAPVSTTQPNDLPFGFFNRRVSKRLFVHDFAWESPSSFGNEMGSSLAQQELEQLFRQLAEAEGIRASGTAVERLTSLVEYLVEAGYEPSIVIAPISWVLTQTLEIERVAEGGGEALGGIVRGWFKGIPFVTSTAAPDDRLIAVDLGAYADLEELHTPDGAVVTPEVRVEPISPARAQEIVQGWGTTPSTDQAAQQRRLETEVLVSVARPLGIRTKDLSASRSVWLPPSARR